MSKSTIHLGFEIGTGAPVEIPLRHLAVTGQTQESGKTTTLEALITRSNLRAIAYVTKRGESSFHVANPIPPYFRERTDWPFVAAILEATMSEKLKFQRSWIMKLCQPHSGKGGAWEMPRSLADVQHNVETALESARGLNESVYTELREYLKMVVPQIERLPYSADLHLEPGVNVMDLSPYEFPLQALVIAAVMQRVYKVERDTINVLPEAWEFAPNQRNTPVRFAAEEFARKGAALKNFLWLDSQDLAGVAHPLLRQVGVWIFGVQRDVHEIKRTIDHIPNLGARPRASDVATLSKGQFIACWEREMHKVYVQPAWMTAAHAEAIARGEETVDSARDILKGYDREHPQKKESGVRSQESEVKKQKAEVWEAVAEGLAPASSPESKIDWKQKFEDANKLAGDLMVQVSDLHLVIERFQNEKRHAVRTKDRPFAPDVSAPNLPAKPDIPKGMVSEVDADRLYADFKARLLKEPAVLAILARKPEIEVSLTREKIAFDGKSLAGRVAVLIANNFFDQPRRHNQIFKELNRTGAGVNAGNLSTELKRLKALGFLTEENGDYRAVEGMKVNVKETQ